MNVYWWKLANGSYWRRHICRYHWPCAPMGKGQRALIVSPPKAGKLSCCKYRKRITRNSLECHLIVLLYWWNCPEEVTESLVPTRWSGCLTFDWATSSPCSSGWNGMKKQKRLVDITWTGHSIRLHYFRLATCLQSQLCPSSGKY